MAGLSQLASLRGAEGQESASANILLSCFEAGRFTLWKSVNCFIRRYGKMVEKVGETFCASAS